MSTPIDPSLRAASPASAVSYRRGSFQSMLSSPREVDDTMNKADLRRDVEKAMDKLALARKQVVVYDTFESLEEKLAVLNVLLAEIASEADGLKAKKTEAQKEYDILQSKLRNAEGDKQNFVLAVQMDKGEKDKVMLRKAELNVMKLKAGMVEKEIEIMEIDMQINDDQAEKAKSNSKVTDAQRDVDATQDRWDALKLELDRAEADFEEKFGSGLGGISKPPGCEDDLTKENEALKEKIENMYPVYKIGHATRARYVAEQLKLLKGTHIDKEIENLSQDAWRLGKIVADAAMFLNLADLYPLIPAEEFEFIYGVPAGFVWQHHNFTMFMKLLGWKQDFRKAKNYFKSDDFTNHYKKLMDKIMPNGHDLEVMSDDELRKDASAQESFLVCEAEHSKVRISTLYGRSSQGPSKNNYSFGGNQRNSSRA